MGVWTELPWWMFALAECFSSWLMGCFLFIFVWQSELQIRIYASLFDIELILKNCLPLSHSPSHFPSCKLCKMFSYSSVHMPLFPGSAIKWTGWLPQLMHRTAGGTHKPNLKHSQETHKDPTAEESLTQTVVN